MTDAPKPTLTEVEREELERSLRWHFAAHAEQPYPGYAGLGVENAVNIVTHIVEAHVAVVRREALLEAAECPSDEWGITWQSRARRLTAEVKRLRAEVARVEALAERYEAMERDEGYGGELWSTTASAIRKTLAEPERDEEGPCSCGSRDATSLTPGEWLHHSPDGCTIERDEEGGR